MVRSYLPIIGAFALVPVVFGGLFWLVGMPLRSDLARCDEAIKATLKAPSTYHRVESPEFKSSFYRIVYDAENSFGVPLRSQGYCNINEGAGAEWVEMPDLH